ncbi:hypothetical protein [Actinoplanes sp. M2I2]|uniref:hypothetical protein n=1 Tax=Actinoplanes sp. M2I2 TaxID=1734444 RepID=UPI002021356C|nr:hypothetical protein [Actinoplanes sp. M2I2]
MQGGLLATEHLRGVFAELHMVTTRRAVGLRAPWNNLGDDGFTPPANTGEALDEALRELASWATTLRTAHRIARSGGERRPALDTRARVIGLVLALGGLMVTVDTTGDRSGASRSPT